MERNWPFFNSMLDMLDMVISKADPDISKIYEEYLADEELKRVGKKLRFQFDVIKRSEEDDFVPEIYKGIEKGGHQVGPSARDAQQRLHGMSP